MKSRLVIVVDFEGDPEQVRRAIVHWAQGQRFTEILGVQVGEVTQVVLEDVNV